MTAQSVNEYLDDLGKKLSTRTVINRPVADIANFPLAKGQCIYLLDFKSQSVTFQKGISDFLGYSSEEFTFDFAVNCFHPNDTDMVKRLIKATLMFASENNVFSNVAFFVTYRVKHKNGNYIKILRQSNVFDCDENGRIISNVSMLSDISFITKSEKVEWKFDAPGLDQEKFRKYVHEAYSDFFSKRELEILSLIKEGLTSKDISRKLHISKHTVDTHRRKMLKKANCKSSMDLVNFASNNTLV